MPATHIISTWGQFNLKSLFVMIGLCTLPLMHATAPFFQHWRRHAQELDPAEAQLIVALYVIAVALIPAVLICYLNDIANPAGGKGNAGVTRQRPYSHTFVFDYIITTVITPLIFVLTPLPFHRSGANALKLSAAVFAIVTAVHAFRTWRRRRVIESIASAALGEGLLNGVHTHTAGNDVANRDASNDESEQQAIKFRYRLMSGDIEAANKAIARFGNRPHIRFVILGVILLATYAVGGNAVRSIILGSLFVLSLVVLGRHNRRNQTSQDFGDVRMSVSPRQLVVALENSMSFLCWERMCGYAATPRHLFVFCPGGKFGKKTPVVAYIIPRRVLPLGAQVHIEAVLRDHLENRNKEVRRRQRRQFARDIGWLCLVVFLSALVLVP